MSKRGTENQITKDDYDRDEDEDSSQEMGTFKKASNEELARRPYVVTTFYGRPGILMLGSKILTFFFLHVNSMKALRRLGPRVRYDAGSKWDHDDETQALANGVFKFGYLDIIEFERRRYQTTLTFCYNGHTLGTIFPIFHRGASQASKSVCKIHFRCASRARNVCILIIGGDFDIITARVLYVILIRGFLHE